MGGMRAGWWLGVLCGLALAGTAGAQPAVQSVQRAGVSPTRLERVPMHVRFDRAVTGVDASDFGIWALSGSLFGLRVGEVSLVNAAEHRYLVEVLVGGGEGLLRLAVLDDDSIVDGEGMPLGGAGFGNGVFTTGQSVRVDRVPPRVMAVLPREGALPGDDTVVFDVVFSEAVNGVSAGAFAVERTGDLIAPRITVTAQSSAWHEVRVEPGYGAGDVRLVLLDEDTVTDGVGNPLGGDGAGNGDHAGPWHRVDRAEPIPEPEDCTAGALYGQAPHGSDDEHTPRISDDGTVDFPLLGSREYWAYERFEGVTEPIEVVRWWGGLVAAGGFACTRSVNRVRITFHEDVDGEIGPLVHSMEVIPARQNTNIPMRLQPSSGIQRHEARLDTPVTLQSGWLGIRGLPPPDANPDFCFFMWHSSAQGDGFTRSNEILGVETRRNDLAFCLLGSGHLASAPDEPGCADEAALFQAPVAVIEPRREASVDDLVEAYPMERIAGLSAPIRRVAWWGWSYDYFLERNCTVPSGDFQLEFHADDGGRPGALVASVRPHHTVEATTLVRREFDPIPVSRYEATLNPPIDLPEGWLRIRRIVNDSCEFYWRPSRSGDLRALWVDGDAVYPSAEDFALCIETAPEDQPEGEGDYEGDNEGEGETTGPRHRADLDGDGRFGLLDLLRLIQFYNARGFGCLAGTEDGYTPGAAPRDCAPHDSDYAPQDWRIGLSELLRAIQFYRSGAYAVCAEGEDGFCPVAPPGTP